MPRIGVCSWSLRPRSPAELAAQVAAVGVDCVQLALGPLAGGGWSVAETRTRLRDAGIDVRSGMLGMHGEDYSTLESIRRTGGVRPDEHWRTNFMHARACAELARELGIGLVTFHAGFMSADRGPSRTMLVLRLRQLVDLFADHGVRLGLETGQESAATLLAVLDELERPTAGVNFDPANMLLYGTGDPVRALEQLAARVVQVHVKDARRATTPGAWGAEVRTGTGEVDWDAFFAVLRRARLECDLMIEREAGAERVADARAARELVAGQIVAGARASAPRTVGVGVVGLGFMGSTHVRGLARAHAAGHANRLVAVADFDRGRLSGKTRASGNLRASADGEPLFDAHAVRVHASAAELFADAEVELVCICTHTDTHVELALAALAAGKHVLVEKPVALRSAEAERLAAAAARARTLCMPAMCMRFWPGWDWLRARVAERTFGAVRSAVFRRVGARPDWSAFYRDEARSGGALFDLHIHDADFVRWCFGAPDAVASHGTREHLTTAYVYAGGPPHVVAEGGWDLSDGFEFEMAFTVAFEGATADFELGRAPELLLAQGGESVAVPHAEGTGWDAEVVHLLDAIARGAPATELRATLPEAVELTRMLEAEAQSLRTGQTVRLG